MSYYIKELESIIKNSKLSKKEIAKNCYISSSSISKVLSEKQIPFSTNINQKICEICNEDTRLLNIAYGLDLIGNDFFEFIELFKNMSLRAFEIQYPNENKDVLIDLYNSSLPKFIIYLLKSVKYDNTYIEKIEEPKFIVNDKPSVILDNDKMESYIHKGSKLYLDYENKDFRKDDIILIELKDNSIIVGILDINLKESLKISFLNRNYKTIEVKKDNIQKIVKVKSFKYEIY